MRPVPYLLATPQFEKWHGVSVLPRADSVLETKLRKLTPAVFIENGCDQPELHRHRLIGTQASCSWTMTAKSGAGCELVSHPRRIRRKKNKHRCQLELEFAPAGDFTAVLSVFQAHLPVHDIKSCEASGLENPGRGIRQYRSAS
jgi:hypothetical protein